MPEDNQPFPPGSPKEAPPLPQPQQGPPESASATPSPPTAATLKQRRNLSHTARPGFFSRGNILALLAGTGVYIITYLAIEFLASFDDQNWSAGSAIFIGLPFISSFIVAALVPEKRDASLVCFLSMLINLILSPFFLGEGVLCVVMALPIFAGITIIGAVMGSLIRGPGAKDARKPRRFMFLLVIAVLLIAAQDVLALRMGVPAETVTTQIELSGTREEVWKRLSFDRAPRARVPGWMRLWVAQPERFAFAEEGLRARRFVDFGERQYGDDADALRNKFVYEITEWKLGESCVFACRENHSRARNWVALLDTRVELSDGSTPQTTRVTLRTRYKRKLGPAFYFAPFLKAAVEGMQEMLAKEIGDSKQ